MAKIQIQCEHCSSRFAVPDSSGGKKIRCPKCQEIILVVVGKGENVRPLPKKITMQCTLCFATLTVPDSAAGKRIPCPKCQGQLQVADAKLRTVKEKAAPPQVIRHSSAVLPDAYPSDSGRPVIKWALVVGGFGLFSLLLVFAGTLSGKATKTNTELATTNTVAEADSLDATRNERLLQEEQNQRDSERKELEEKLAQVELEKSNYRREMEAMKADARVKHQETPVADANVSAADTEKQKVEAFLTQWFRTPIQDRSSLVLNTREFESLCDKYHTHTVDVDATYSNARISDGPIPSYLTVTDGKLVHFGERMDVGGKYYLKRVADKFFVDWSATFGINEPSFLAWKAENDTRSIETFRVEAKLGQDPSAGTIYPKDLFYTIDMRVDGEFDIAYVEKSTRLGQAVFELLKDGKNHSIMLDLQIEDYESRDYFTIRIVGLSSHSWVEGDGERID